MYIYIFYVSGTGSRVIFREIAEILVKEFLA